MSSISEGDAVRWKWGTGYGYGRVQSVFTKTVQRTLGGSEITRHGSKEDPALYIVNDEEGSHNVLKLASEVEPV